MNPARLWALLMIGLLLAGCGGRHSDLRQFVADVKARPAGPIKPIPQVSHYDPYAYNVNGRRAPFTPNIPNPHDQTVHHGLAPDFNRPRGPLEHFPLDALHMVGTITSAGTTYALIHAPDDVIYRAARGDHMGQHFGRITSVSDQGVTLVEIVPDGSGGYTKRATAIAPSG